MRNSAGAVAWVVYKMAVSGKKLPAATVRLVICEQSEWDALERKTPGLHTLVRSGITNEGEAERLARDTSGDPFKRR